MNYKVKQVIRESRIITFFASLNRNLLIYFYDSAIYKLFTKLSTFSKKIILENRDKSLILESVRRLFKHVGVKDFGCFIVLVVIFNSLIEILLGRKIDAFSVLSRISFFTIGAFLIFKKEDRTPR